MTRESFVFYRSFYEAIKNLPTDDQVTVFRAICRYALYGEQIELEGLSESIFILVKPQIDANTRKYENGKKGGRPPKSEPTNNQTETYEKPNNNQTETKSKPNNNQDITKPEPNVNVNVNDNVNENVNVNENENDNADRLSNSICNNTSTDSDIMQEIEKYFGNRN